MRGNVCSFFLLLTCLFPSTLFGVCVLQIKPQLEKLLKLPADALTKEIALTQVYCLFYRLVELYRSASMYDVFACMFDY